MRLPLFAFASLSAFALGCVSSPSVGGSSFPSTGSSSYSAGSPSFSVSTPQREAVSGAIVVRPDLVCFPFALHARAEDLTKANSELRATVEEIVQRLGEVAGVHFQVRMRGFAIEPLTSSKAHGSRLFAASVDGALELPLAEGLDYWARSRLMTLIEAAIAQEETKYDSGLMKATFSPAQFQVREPEAFRARLVEQWVKRARAFADAAQSPALPLQITDCAAPGEVMQRSVSNEEVALSLSIACHIDAARAK